MWGPLPKRPLTSKHINNSKHWNNQLLFFYNIGSKQKQKKTSLLTNSQVLQEQKCSFNITQWSTFLLRQIIDNSRLFLGTSVPEFQFLHFIYLILLNMAPNYNFFKANICLLQVVVNFQWRGIPKNVLLDVNYSSSMNATLKKTIIKKFSWFINSLKEVQRLERLLGFLLVCIRNPYCLELQVCPKWTTTNLLLMY